jgi:hypothetical protein
MNLKSNAKEAKCEGMGCAYKQSCGRYLRPSAGGHQHWASWYAIAEEDCAAVEVVRVNGFGEHKEVQ